MNRVGWFLCGAITLSLLAFGASAALVFNARGFRANDAPSDVETWIARKARSAALPSAAGALANPLPNTPEILAEARAHWADHCAACHANDGSGDTPLGKRTYPPAPDMRLPATQQLTDGELFFIIQNGIRFTAMPAWGGGPGHDEEDTWK